jgi:hypothetical protein
MEFFNQITYLKPEKDTSAFTCHGQWNLVELKSLVGIWKKKKDNRHLIVAPHTALAHP